MSSEKESGERTIQVAVTGEDDELVERSHPGQDVLVAGRYRLGRRIGKGGMGEVMAARDEQIGRDVAIKRMRAANPSERAILRFLREASVQGRLEHPAIVPVHEIGRDSDGLPFFVMKKLTGTSLAQILVDENRTTFPLQHVLRAFADVCLAVEFAHVRGIVHRDLKADNIMLGDFGEAYVLDWGVAKVLGEDDGDFADVGSGSGEGATAAGTAIGTPGYMAPEQVRGNADIDGRADVYTLGCLLFEILAGEPLHPRGFEGLQSALAGREARPSLRAPTRDIPPELDALCVDACATNRDARVQTARELGARVQRFLDGDRDLATRRELARDHLKRAQAAFDSDDSAERRRTAMREAAGALALDPTLGVAAALVGRLMLEAPREVPRDVIDAIEKDDVRAAKTIARAGLWAVAGSLAFMPLLWWIAPSGTPYVPVLAALLLLDGAIAVYWMRSKAPPHSLVVMIANAFIVLVLARMFSPILIAPGVAASLAMAMALTPRLSWLGSSLVVALVMIGVVIAPLVLERVGVLSITMSVDANGVLFRAPAVAGLEGPTIVVGALYAIALIAGACVAGEAVRRRTRDAHRHLHLQAWQLRQLVESQ